MKYITIRVHNNSVTYVQEVMSMAEGRDLIKKWGEESLKRPLNKEEEDYLNSVSEVFDESDSDNIWCYSVMIID